MRTLITGLALASAAALVASAAMAQPEERSNGRKITATLTGAAERPGPGDPNGAGLFEGRVNAGQGRICYTLSAGNIAPATGAHIHIGGAAVAGAVVLTLETPDGQDDDAEECQDIDRTLAQQLIQNPQNYYVNIHTGDYAGGAIRGQLMK